MEDEMLLGDIDAWFDAFERGDFLVVWDLQQQVLHAQFDASCARFDVTACDAAPACDAAED